MAYFEEHWLGHSRTPGPRELAEFMVTELGAELPTVRCAIPARAQPGLASDPGVLRAIVRALEQNLGVYASVRMPGRIAVGDPVAVA